MSMFRKRSMKPNQMQTVRRLEEEVDIGKVIDAYICARTTSVSQATFNVIVVRQVMYSEHGLAILEGLNNDAPVGASLRFVSGASG